MEEQLTAEGGCATRVRKITELFWATAEAAAEQILHARVKRIVG